MVTLPEPNIAPENGPLEKEIPMETLIFRGYVSFRECNLQLFHDRDIFALTDIQV